jgi:general secretion pathway protein A
MYNQFFRLTQTPFSIAPDPHYVYMSRRHREALAHLLYGVNAGGGFVLLTGEIGAGKTTICRRFLEQVPAQCNVAYVFNPKLTVLDLLRTICEEFHIHIDVDGSRTLGIKDYVDTLNRFLLTSYANGQNNVLIIDEAQNLSDDVLEQLRLLTNLETNERKLLQIILIGQPELRTMLARPELEQLAQRVIARYHLGALSLLETVGYILHRLSVAGLQGGSPFPPDAIRKIHQLTKGIPRRINLICDRALLGAYTENKFEVDQKILSKAASEVFSLMPSPARHVRRHAISGALAILAVSAAGVWAWQQRTPPAPAAVPAAVVSPASPVAQDRMPEPAAPLVDRANSTPAQPVLRQVATATQASQPPPVDIRDMAAAQRELASLWGLELDGNAPCEEARAASLQCYSSSAGFAALRRLDRPAVLTLQDENGKPYYGLLLALDSSDATVRVGNRMQTVSVVALGRRFGGRFSTFWRAPPQYRNRLAIGDQGADVDWLAAQLARLGGDAAPAANQPFDERIAAQVRDFQFAQGLTVDGLAGPHTMMHLNRVAGVDEPRLHAPATTAASGLNQHVLHP